MPIEFLDIILFAMIAAFIGFRLYNVLGRRTGNERSPDEQVRVPETPAKQRTEDNVVKLPERASANTTANVSPSDPVARAMMDIKLADRSFDEAQFVEGARAAYEMIVTAFAEGDRDTLRPFLSEEVFGAFDRAISQREKHDQTMEFNFLGLEASKITAAELKNQTAEITIAFKSEVIEALRDKADDLVEGESIAANHVNDVWTFARDVTARDPNWALVATSSA
jgi:predicted lipid-binding transport protein (Tim44 family)